MALTESQFPHPRKEPITSTTRAGGEGECRASKAPAGAQERCFLLLLSSLPTAPSRLSNGAQGWEGLWRSVSLSFSPRLSLSLLYFQTVQQMLLTKADGMYPPPPLGRSMPTSPISGSPPWHPWPTLQRNGKPCVLPGIHTPLPLPEFSAWASVIAKNWGPGL